MASGKRRSVDVSRIADRLPTNREIAEFFEKLNLGSAAEREKYFWLDRLSKLDLEQEKANQELRVVFGDSTTIDPAPK